jgi:hypothetical protein
MPFETSTQPVFHSVNEKSTVDLVSEGKCFIASRVVELLFGSLEGFYLAGDNIVSSLTGLAPGAFHLLSLKDPGVSNCFFKKEIGAETLFQV